MPGLSRSHTAQLFNQLTTMISTIDYEGTVEFDDLPQPRQVLLKPAECWPEAARYIEQHNGIVRVCSKHLEIYDIYPEQEESTPDTVVPITVIIAPCQVVFQGPGWTYSFTEHDKLQAWLTAEEGGER